MPSIQVKSYRGVSAGEEDTLPLHKSPGVDITSSPYSYRTFMLNKNFVFIWRYQEK